MNLFLVVSYSEAKDNDIFNFLFPLMCLYKLFNCANIYAEIQYICIWKRALWYHRILMYPAAFYY